MLPIERIDAEAFARWGEMKGAPLAMCRGFARAIEAEVRKQDEALILHMRSVLEFLESADISLHASGWGDLNAAIAAADARLEGQPCD